MLRGRHRDERGASLVEFALLLPVFVLLALGMLTGGLTYNRKLTITNGAREASRYAATLPLSNYANVGEWIDAVGGVAIGAASGEVDSGAAGREICIAYVDAANAATRKVVTGTQTFPGQATQPQQCFTDSRTNEARVQVLLKRDGKIELGVWSPINMKLTGKSVARFEGSDS